ncbi:MAG: aminodeoxychorismate lyase, partial [Alphaproteobacteria bacterium]|nr:aminodeoxychorismate lyase [Alphaproteobacteria bacterium]
MARRAREFRSDRRGGPNPFLAALAWIASAVTTAAAVLLVAAVLVIVEANRAGPAHHDGAAQIARHLQQEKVIRSALVFRVATIVYARNRTLKAGEYAIEPGASMRSVIDQVAAGRVMLHPITVPEGLTSQMVADIINGSEVLSGDPIVAPAEGVLLPETYKVARGVDRASLIKKMMSAH